MRYATRALALLCLGLLLSGCATMADSIDAKGTGQFRIYDKGYDSVWNAVLDVVTASQLDVVSRDKDNGQILAQRGMSALSYGQNVAVFVETAGSASRTRVEVVSKKAVATDVLARNWENYILEALDGKLN